MHNLTPAQIAPPVFLVGAERSGTTLLRLMLDSHPDLAFRYESEVLVEKISEDGVFPDLAQYHEHLRTYRFVDRPIIDPNLDYASLARSILEQKRAADGKPRIGAVVHSHFDRLLFLWPDARFIHILRDGRDVARSVVEMGWEGEAWGGVERWLLAEQLWMKMQKLVTPERCLDVRYEELVTDPVATLTRICEFIGIGYTDAMFAYTQTSPYRYPDPSLAFQWKHKLSAREVQLVESRIGHMLAVRGYALSGLPQLELDASERAILGLRNWLGVGLHRVQSLGPRLWAESVLARRIGSKRWRNSVQFRVNACINDGLRGVASRAPMHALSRAA